jgi:hypothetical protein
MHGARTVTVRVSGTLERGQLPQAIQSAAKRSNSTGRRAGRSELFERIVEGFLRRCGCGAFTIGFFGFFVQGVVEVSDRPLERVLITSERAVFFCELGETQEIAAIAPGLDDDVNG